MACEDLRKYAQARLDHLNAMGERAHKEFSEKANYSISIINFAKFLPALKRTMAESFQGIENLDAKLAKVEAEIREGYNAYETKLLSGSGTLEPKVGQPEKEPRKSWVELQKIDREWTDYMERRRAAARIPARQHAIIAGRFAHLGSFKKWRSIESGRTSGIIVTALRRVFQEAALEQELKRIGGATPEGTPFEEQTGFQSGHVDGSAVSSLKVLQQEAMKGTFESWDDLSPAEHDVVNLVERSYKASMDVRISADSAFDHNGNGKSNYSSSVEAEDTMTNQRKSTNEKEMLDEYRDNWKILADMACPSDIYDMFRDILLHNFVDYVQHGDWSITGEGTPKKSVKQHASDHAKQDITHKITHQEFAGVIGVKGEVAKRMREKISGTATPNKATGVSNAPLALLGMFQTQLPDVVRKNMGPPRLTNRKGTFADSVKVPREALITTPQGFPSFGFTYQRNPYQTFEPGGAQGSTDYDPRTLIESSMREIAAKQAIGRFYTRRV